MSEFKPIETQEQFNAMIKDRLDQAERSFLEKYGNSEELKTQLADKDSQIADITKQLEEANKKIEGHKSEMDGLNAKVHKYEIDSVKTRVAQEEGLPYAMASRLSGETEDDIRADAKSIAKLMAKSAPPAFNPEPKSTDPSKAAWTELSKSFSRD